MCLRAAAVSTVASQSESKRGAFLRGVCIFCLEYSGFLPSPNTCIWGIGELAALNSSQTWAWHFFYLVEVGAETYYQLPLGKWRSTHLDKSQLITRRIHRDKQYHSSPQRLECCWCLLHWGRVKVEMAKWSADKSIFYSICPVPFCQQVKEQEIKSGQWNVFIHNCTFRVLHYRIRSENPHWNQIICAAPRRKPTCQWKRCDCEQHAAWQHD